MIKYKEYTLRFDVSAMEALSEISPGMVEGLKKAKTGNVDMIRSIFGILATAGEEYLAEKENREPKPVSTEGLIKKHSSAGTVRIIMKAIEEAIADGNRVEFGKDDDQIRDGYLDEYRQMEREQGKN